MLNAKRRIVLVGPPGVGKSSLVRLAKERGITAIDLEEIHDQKSRELGDDQEALRIEMDRVIEELMESAPEGLSIYGAGSYGSHFPIDRIEKVLLLPNKEIARRRFLERDEGDEDKKSQNQDFDRIYDGFVENWKTGQRKYHRVIEVDGTVEEILELVVSECKLISYSFRMEVGGD